MDSKAKILQFSVSDSSRGIRISISNMVIVFIVSACSNVVIVFIVSGNTGTIYWLRLVFVIVVEGLDWLRLGSGASGLGANGIGNIACNRLSCGLRRSLYCIRGGGRIVPIFRSRR